MSWQNPQNTQILIHTTIAWGISNEALFTSLMGGNNIKAYRRSNKFWQSNNARGRARFFLLLGKYYKYCRKNCVHFYYAWVLGKRVIKSIENIRGLRSIKCSSKTLQNLLYLMYKKSHVVFFIILYNFTFPLRNAMNYVNIDQDIHKVKKVKLYQFAQNEKQTKTIWLFSYIKYSKYLSISL